MIEPAIDAFFSERKEAWLKKNIKSSMDEMQIEEKKRECDQVFSLASWIPDAARRAGQMSLATHPCTYSHPSARKNKNGYATPIIAKASKRADGFLRSGNVGVDTDALGNAAVLDVYKFLTLTMSDSRKLIDHIQEDSSLARSLLNLETADYESVKFGLLKMVETNESVETITSSKVKQVYFPVSTTSSDNYHLLSLLSNSGIIYELKSRIDQVRFSDQAKESREKKRSNAYSEQQFSELFNLTVIGYGGTKPQNISVLNNQNGGKAYLLQSAPPSVEKRTIHFPQYNFFRESLRPHEYRDVFFALHKLFKTDYNNVRIREGRDYRLQDLVDRIIDKMWAVRAVCHEQYRPDNSHLKTHQKIWLCEEFRQVREEEDSWLDKLCAEISGWTIRTYEKLLGKQAVKLGEPERLHIAKIVDENREALR